MSHQLNFTSLKLDENNTPAFASHFSLSLFVYPASLLQIPQHARSVCLRSGLPGAVTNV